MSLSNKLVIEIPCWAFFFMVLLRAMEWGLFSSAHLLSYDPFGCWLPSRIIPLYIFFQVSGRYLAVPIFSPITLEWHQVWLYFLDNVEVSCFSGNDVLALKIRFDHRFFVGFSAAVSVVNIKCIHAFFSLKTEDHVVHKCGTMFWK